MPRCNEKEVSLVNNNENTSENTSAEATRERGQKREMPMVQGDLRFCARHTKQRPAGGETSGKQAGNNPEQGGMEPRACRSLLISRIPELPRLRTRVLEGESCPAMMRCGSARDDR